jgi:WD40 repeat protein
MPSPRYELELVRRFEPSQSAAFVRNGDALLVASGPARGGYELELFDLKKLRPLARASVEKFASLARAGDEHALVLFARGSAGGGASRDKQRVEVRRLKDLAASASFIEEKPGSLAVHPDGTRVAVAHDFGSLKVWDARAGELTFEFKSKGFGGVAYSHDGALLAAQEFAGALKIFDAAAPQDGPLRSTAVGGSALQIAFHPRRHIVAAGGKNAIKFVNADTGKVTASAKTTKREARDSIGRVSFSPGGELLVTSTFSEGVVGLWDVEEAEFVCHLLEPDAPVNRVEFDARGEYLLVSTYEAAELYAFVRG